MYTSVILMRQHSCHAYTMCGHGLSLTGGSPLPNELPAAAAAPRGFPAEGMGSAGERWKAPLPKAGEGMCTAAPAWKAGTTWPMGVAGTDGDGMLNELEGEGTGGPPRDGGRPALTRACTVFQKNVFQACLTVGVASVHQQAQRLVNISLKEFCKP